MKNLDEDTLEQFFSDVGFIPPRGVPNPMGLFVDDSTIPLNSKEDRDSVENSTQKIVNSLFTDIISDFIGHLSAAIPTYQEPEMSGLNKDYHKKDLKQTHSFSDTKLEAPSLGSSDFPKHELAPQQVPDYMIDNKPYWLVHHE